MSEILFILEWFLIIELIGLFTFPLAAFLCRLPDRGYSISKLIGLLLMTYVTWLLVSLRISGFGIFVITAALLILVLFSLLKFNRDILSLKSTLLKSELVFAVSFFVFVFIVMNRPDIYAPNSEDFMDFGFLQSILRSTNFPPPDPWLAGNTLNYYYFGQLLVAILTKISAIPSTITYNLANATFFALAVQASYGLLYNLTKRSFYGLLGALFVSVSGIMSGFLQLLVYLVPATREFIHYAPLKSPDIIQWLLNFDFWNSISIIPQTFNFYPFHTFASGYLHAQMMSIPFQLMLITVGLSLFRAEKVAVWDVLFVSVGVGFFGGLSIWEYPAYILFVCIIFFISHRKKAIYLSAQTILLSIILFLPYYLSRNAGGFGGVMLLDQRTSILNFFEIFALFVFLIVSFLLLYIWNQRKKISSNLGLIFLVILFMTLAAGIFIDFQTLPLLTLLILISVYGMIKFDGKDAKFILMLVLTGSLIALFVEIFYIKDEMPWKRFNTVMKLHLEIWVLWGIASAYAVYYANNNGYFKGKSRIIWTLFVIFLIFASLAHPIASITSWTSGKTFFGSSTRGALDGIAYLKKENIGDYLAIRWINGNITGNPVVLEAPGSAYVYSSQISSLTGLPTVIGWMSHEQLWNSDWGKIYERVADTNEIYSTSDMKTAIALLKKYNVQYVYVGDIEASKYPPAGLAKFDDKEHFELVYFDKWQLFKVK